MVALLKSVCNLHNWYGFGVVLKEGKMAQVRLLT